MEHYSTPNQYITFYDLSDDEQSSLIKSNNENEQLNLELELLIKENTELKNIIKQLNEEIIGLKCDKKIIQNNTGDEIFKLKIELSKLKIDKTILENDVLLLKKQNDKLESKNTQMRAEALKRLNQMNIYALLFILIILHYQMNFKDTSKSKLSLFENTRAIKDFDKVINEYKSLLSCDDLDRISKRIENDLVCYMLHIAADSFLDEQREKIYKIKNLLI